MADTLHLQDEESAIDRLIDAGTLTGDDVAHARSLIQDDHMSLLVMLNRMGVLSDDALAATYQSMTGYRIVTEKDLSSGDTFEDACNPLFLKRVQAILLSPNGPLAVVNPLNDRALRGIQFALGFAPERVIVKSGDWARAFSARYEADLDLSGVGGAEQDDFSSELADQDRDAPIVRRVASWLSDAADMGASDIHFEARRSVLEVRYRVDGVLRTVAREPKTAISSVIARIKVLSDLDLGERNKSQDGRATIVVRGRRLDVRVSIISTIDGESAVIRLLDKPARLLSIESLGFAEDISQTLQTVMSKRNGLFVVAGPTGSGKTTTLYACLESLKGTGLKILSVEDPVEYHFEHVNQVQISDHEGRGFADALRAFLRHDPDVILVGEIRDSETAKIAVEAALQGHLVLATLHAIDVARVRTRLLDMGVEAFQLEATLAGSLAQRLVRLLCPECKKLRFVSDAEADVFTQAGLEVPTEIADPLGCPACKDEGYRKRTVIAEAMLGASGKTSTLRVQGLALVANGKTTLREILSLDVG